MGWLGATARLGNEQADGAAQQTLGAVDRKQGLWRSYRHYACAFRNFLGAIGPSLNERQEKLQVRPRLVQEEAPLAEMEWPFPFEGDALERGLDGL
eukprot:3120805-Amphidinium_carterae.1